MPQEVLQQSRYVEEELSRRLSEVYTSFYLQRNQVYILELTDPFMIRQLLWAKGIFWPSFDSSADFRKLECNGLVKTVVDSFVILLIS